MLRVTFVQDVLLHYRLGLYAELAAAENWEVSVVHSGPPQGRSSVGFRETVVPRIDFGPVYWQRGLKRAVAGSDAIVAMMDLRAMSSVALASARWRPPLVYWGIGRGRKTELDRFRVALARRADALALYSEGPMPLYLEGGVPPDRIHIAHNTIHVPNPSRASGPRQTILSLGTLNRRKKLDELCRAFAAVARSSTSLRLEFLGDGEDRERLGTIVEELGIGGQVVFHGRVVEPDAIARMLDRSLVVVSPGQAGLSVLHSFAHGVPFVAREDAITGGELSNIRNGENGVLYRGGHDELAGILTRIIDSDNWAHKLGEAALQHYRDNRTMAGMARGMAGAVRQAVDRTT